MGAGRRRTGPGRTAHGDRAAHVPPVRDEWLASAPGAAAADAPALAVTQRALPAGLSADLSACLSAGPGARAAGRAGRPYAGVRVLDLTRVIAGPIGTRFLAAYGAE